jgi:hypothetical protein
MKRGLWKRRGLESKERDEELMEGSSSSSFSSQGERKECFWIKKEKGEGKRPKWEHENDDGK